MEQVIRITALCVVAALLALVIRRGTPELALLLAVGCTVVVLLSLEELGERSGVSRELFEPLCKTIGISFVVKLGGELCRDAGESAMAAVVESAGAVCALLVALPLLRAVLSQLVGLMQ